MNKLIMSLLLLPQNVFAIDYLTVDIERLTLSGPNGTLTTKELVVGEGNDRIGYKNAGELLFGELLLNPKGLELKTSNGMFITSTDSLGVDLVKELNVENGFLNVDPKVTKFSADYVMASNAKAKGEGKGIHVVCEKKKDCNVSADKLLVDGQTMLKKVTFSCLQAKCSNQFQFNVGELDEGRSIKFRSLQTRGFIEIKDLRNLSLKRVDQRLTLDGNLKLLVGSIGFDVEADIVTLNDDVIELSLKKVKLSDTLSIRDLTKYLIRELLSSKSVSMNGDDHIVIKLR